MKPGYKKTEVGVIPEEWEVNTIGGFCTCFSGGTPNTSNPSYYGGNIAWITSSDLNKARIAEVDGRITEDGLANSASKIVNKGTLLLALYGATAGVCAVSEIQAAINQAVLAISPRRGDIEYLFQFLTLRKDHFIKTYTQGGQPNFSGEIVKSFYVPVPPLPEQRAIATALSDVDGLLGGLDRLIAKKRDLKQAAMQQLLTGQTRLPGFNGEWELKRLGDVAAVSKGTQLHSSETDDGGKFAHLNGGITPSSYTHKSNTDGNTIAISEGGNSCGFVQFMTEPYWCGGHCYSVIPNGVDNHFLYHALKGQQSAIMGLRVGSGLPNVQKTGLLDFKIQLPATHPEQTAIAEVLSEMDGELAALEQRREKTRAVKQAMMQELLTGRTRLL